MSEKTEGTAIKEGYTNYIAPAVTTASPYVGAAYEKTKEGVTYAATGIANTGTEVYQHGTQAPSLQNAKQKASEAGEKIQEHSSGYASWAFGHLSTFASKTKENVTAYAE